MPRSGDQRGVSELLGAILVFGLLLLLLVLAQVALVPTLNQQVEFEHSNRAADDLTDLQTGVFRVSATGAPERVTIEAGVSYPNRPLLLNPPPVQGVLQTGDPSQITISNVLADGETGDYWNGTRVGGYDTRQLQYAAQYNEYASGGTVLFENSLLYSRYDSGVVLTAGQGSLIDDRRISITAINGDLFDASQATTSVALTPISAPSKPVSVTNAPGEKITISVLTTLPEDEWVKIMAGQPFVETPIGYDPVPNSEFSRLTITLVPGETYDLRLAHVGLGEGFAGEDPAYLTRDRGTLVSVPTSGGEISVDVRDRFNNPVSGVPVQFTTTGGTLSASTVSSDADGRATVVLSGDNDTVTITATGEFDGIFTTADYETVVFQAQIGTGDPTPADPNDGDEINPNSPDGNLIYVNATIPAQKSSLVTATFLNTKQVGNGPVSIEQIRINFLGSNAPGSSGAQDLPYADFASEDGTVTARLDISGQYVTLPSPITVPEGEFEELTFDFGFDGATVELIDGDFFVVTMIFEDGDRATYFLRVAENKQSGGGNPNN